MNTTTYVFMGEIKTILFSEKLSYQEVSGTAKGWCNAIK